MEIDYTKFRKNLRIVRDSKGLTGKSLSIELKLKQHKRINDIEDGRATPSFDEVYSICKFLGVSIEDMIDKTVEATFVWK